MKVEILSLLVRISLVAAIISVSQAAATEDVRGRPFPFPEKDKPPIDTNKKCECYIVSGPDPGYFQNYRFWDFRSVPLYPELAKNYQFRPLVKNARTSTATKKKGKDDRSKAATTSTRREPILLSDTPFSEDWIIQDWGRDGSPLFPVSIMNAEENVFITGSSWDEDDDDKTHLVLRTTRMEDYSSTAEIESRLHNVLHCSVRVRLRLFSGDGVIDQPSLSGVDDLSISPVKKPGTSSSSAAMARPSSGACAGIFTYYSTSSESDIEILTSDPPYRVHYANQPDYDPVTDDMIPGASTTADLPVPWTSWATHRLDWFPRVSRWYIDGDHQESKTYSVPYNPSMLVVNLWSDGGNWTGDMEVGDSVHMGIEWIEIAYNISKNRDGTDEIPKRRHPNHGMHILSETVEMEHIIRDDESRDMMNRGCRVGCRIDDVEHDGIPEVLWDFTVPSSQSKSWRSPYHAA